MNALMAVTDYFHGQGTICVLFAHHCFFVSSFSLYDCDVCKRFEDESKFVPNQIYIDFDKVLYRKIYKL